jgi:hypothetical protein
MPHTANLVGYDISTTTLVILLATIIKNKSKYNSNTKVYIVAHLQAK